jgi:hypothetical protein
MRRLLLLIALLASLSSLIAGQENSKPITNEDVLSMTKAGLTEQTILLVIERGPTAFDTSPQSLTQLKKAGVKDAVLDGMLKTPGSIGPDSRTKPIPSYLLRSIESIDPNQLFERALLAIAPMDVLASITSSRIVFSTTQTRLQGTTTFEMERQMIYPDRIFLEMRRSNFPSTQLVIRPDGNYALNGSTRSVAPPAYVSDQLTVMKFDAAYIAQHRSEFTAILDGKDEINGDSCDRLRISTTDGKEEIWSVDSASRIRRRIQTTSSGKVTINYSDFKTIDGVNVAFQRHAIDPNGTTDTTIKFYKFNPPRYSMTSALTEEHPTQGGTVSSRALPRPIDGSLAIRVLEAQSVPYVQKLGGGPSTSCNISGGSNTTMSASTFGNYTYGNANTSTDLHLNCSSYDTTVNWPHVLNVMLVEASDGNAYMIACDRAWAWSKCVPLRAGDTFKARQTNRGLTVEAYNAKGKESEPTYSILQSKVMH